MKKPKVYVKGSYSAENTAPALPEAPGFELSNFCTSLCNNNVFFWKLKYVNLFYEDPQMFENARHLGIVKWW